MRLELVLVGDELLEDSGGVQPRYIQDMLRQIHEDAWRAGATVARLTIVGDSDGEMAGALRDAAARLVGTVLVFGGLGPTHDDRTREEAAAVIGKGPPRPHPEAMAWLAARSRDKGLPPPAPGSHQERMAMCPPGATPVRNINGMAAGFRFRLPPATEVWCLPGVTIEALPMWREHVLPVLAVYSDGPVDRMEATIMVRGVREGAIAPVVEELLTRRAGVRAGVYLTELEGESFRAVRVVLRGRSRDVPPAFDELVEMLRRLPGSTVDGARKRLSPGG